MRHGSLRVRITAVATAVIAVPIAAVAVFGAVFLRTEAMRYDSAPARINHICVSARLQADVVGLVDFGQDCRGGGHSAATPATRVGDVVVPGVADADKVVSCEAHYESSAEIPELSLWPFTHADDVRFTRVSDTGVRVPAHPTTHLGRLNQAALAQAQTTLNHRVLLLALAATVLIALFGLVVWFATGRVLRPVEAIRREVAHITEHDLTRRVPLPRCRHEIARLAVTVNATLDRLQTAIEDNRRFVADASHELRSPIAALRAELEIATAHPDLADWRQVVDSALADTYRLQRLAADLLLLARLDAPPATGALPPTTGALPPKSGAPSPAKGALPPTTGAPVDLTEVVLGTTAQARQDRSTGATEQTRPDRVTVVTETGGPVPVAGSRVLLGRLLANLVDNALRHAATTVTVRLGVEDGHARLDVVYDGPGVPGEERDRIFQRFTRLDEARARDDGGAGLGLAIARRIAAAHHGTLVVEDHPGGGAWFTARIPLHRPWPRSIP